MKTSNQLSPPTTEINPLSWLQKNLFSTWYNSVLTIISILFLYWVVSGLLYWAFTEAQWEVLSANLRLFFTGLYPVKSLWRTWVTLGIIVELGGLSWGILAHATGYLFNTRILIILGLIAVTCVSVAIPVGIQASIILLGMLILLIASAAVGKEIGSKIPNILSWLPLIWLGAFFLNLWLLLAVENVKLDNLSGLILTILIAVVSICLCFPFGVLLALGRQSKLPVIRWLSIAYIEIVRGLPLIGILFMAQVMLPLVLPADIRPDRVVRAIAGFTIFSSAYLAENVRGGLQSIPLGQTEAAKALGLNPILTLTLIVLPQALKAVIPSIVGQFISLFKDTSLLAIVGLVDLLGISQKILANPKFLGRYGEVYIFVAAIYWLCCYSMSLASRRLEQ
ncbi:MAG: amino acid ABC transporter permease [Xenococcaceae cyanobacterium MO_167.B27]|nr:amino acid ABC transporter permease [Xenococcaceae cyanobacterium MO_167.B27]